MLIAQARPSRISAAGGIAAEGKVYFEEASQLALAANNMRANALIHAAYGRVLAASGSADEYVAKLREAQALAGSDDPSLVMTLNAVLCHALRLSGRMREALAVNSEASSHAHEIGAGRADLQARRGARLLFIRYCGTVSGKLLG